LSLPAFKALGGDEASAGKEISLAAQNPKICLYLDRMATEFRVLSVRDAILRDPKIKYTDGYTKWAIQNHHVLA